MERVLGVSGEVLGVSGEGVRGCVCYGIIVGWGMGE